ncbi:hypothetical protein KFU94_00765 [Chloroflexi bacterium TSY]|nr:hypothetical protein [Chloroflexi bacterium TSY]
MTGQSVAGGFVPQDGGICESDFVDSCATLRFDDSGTPIPRATCATHIRPIQRENLPTVGALGQVSLALLVA